MPVKNNNNPTQSTGLPAESATTSVCKSTRNGNQLKISNMFPTKRSRSPKDSDEDVFKKPKLSEHEEPQLIASNCEDAKIDDSNTETKAQNKDNASPSMDTNNEEELIDEEDSSNSTDDRNSDKSPFSDRKTNSIKNVISEESEKDNAKEIIAAFFLE